MSFFEPPPPREEPKQRPQPPWIQPPTNELGVALPFRKIAVRADAFALLVDGLVVYSTGFLFRLAGRSRPDADGQARPGFDTLFGPRSRQGDVMAQLLCGIEFADGRKATSLRMGPPVEGQPSMTQRGGGGGAGQFDTGWWVWPLPPAGALSLVLQWDEQGIPLTRLELDAAAIGAAAAESEVLWPEQSSGAPHSRASVRWSAGREVS